MKYVWLDIETGEFSNSWTQEEHDRYFNEKHFKDIRPTLKLIKFECITDVDFEFMNKMRLK